MVTVVTEEVIVTYFSKNASATDEMFSGQFFFAILAMFTNIIEKAN